VILTIAPHALALGLLAQAGESPAVGGASLFDRINSGGVIGYIIISLSFVAVAFIVVHIVRIRLNALAPQYFIDELDDLLSKGDADRALTACEDPQNSCFLARVMAAGLSRYQRSPFGALELKGSLEEAGQEQIAKLYRSTDALALVAQISPMLGLLGTVVGLTGAFLTISQTEGFARPDQLAGDISLALITTILGLAVAIPVTAVVAFFRNRIDALAGEVAAIVDDLAGHLEEGASRASAPGGARTPGAAPRPGAGPRLSATGPGAGAQGGPKGRPEAPPAQARPSATRQ